MSDAMLAVLLHLSRSIEMLALHVTTTGAETDSRLSALAAAQSAQSAQLAAMTQNTPAAPSA